MEPKLSHLIFFGDFAVECEGIDMRWNAAMEDRIEIRDGLCLRELLHCGSDEDYSWVVMPRGL